MSLPSRPLYTAGDEARPKPKSFWRKDVPVMDGHRIKRGGMWHHQRAWWELPNFVRLLVGGFGAGKTISICKWAINKALRNSPHPVALVSPTYNIARQTTITTIMEMLEGKRSLLRDLTWTYNKNEHLFTFRVRRLVGKIIIYSGDNPLSLRGPNLAAAGIDEPFIQDREVFEQIVARVRHPAAFDKGIALSGTPEQLNWGYDLAEGDLSERYDVGIVHADTRENKALEPDYARRLLEGYDEQAAKAYVEGQFVHLGKGLVVYAFDPVEHIVPLARPANAKLVCGMDFNVDPMAATVAWVHEKHMHIFAEHELPNSDTEDMCGLLKELYWDQGLRDIFPDPTGNRRQSNAPAGVTDMAIIKRFGFTVRAPQAPWPRRDRFNALNGKLKPRDGAVSLTMSPECKRLRRCYSTYSHENLNTDAGKEASHLVDASSYPVVYLFPIKRDWTKMVKIRGV